jgi:hypothetical protein
MFETKFSGSIRILERWVEFKMEDINRKTGMCFVQHPSCCQLIPWNRLFFIGSTTSKLAQAITILKRRVYNT